MLPHFANQNVSAHAVVTCKVAFLHSALSWLLLFSIIVVYKMAAVEFSLV